MKTVSKEPLFIQEDKEITVLIVDDSKLSRDLIKLHLEGIHLNVLEAENGQQALEIIKSGDHTISLVITDYQMPVMDGLEMTRKIREAEARTDCPKTTIIATTAGALKEEADRGYDAGMADYPTKPIQTQELKEVMQKWVGDQSLTKGPGST